jgi:hypothetical protein
VLPVVTEFVAVVDPVSGLLEELRKAGGALIQVSQFGVGDSVVARPCREDATVGWRRSRYGSSPIDRCRRAAIGDLADAAGHDVAVWRTEGWRLSQMSHAIASGSSAGSSSKLARIPTPRIRD